MPEVGGLIIKDGNRCSKQALLAVTLLLGNVQDNLKKINF